MYFHTHFRVQVMLIIEDTTVTVKCITGIKAWLLYLSWIVSHVYLLQYSFLVTTNLPFF